MERPDLKDWTLFRFTTNDPNFRIEIQIPVRKDTEGQTAGNPGKDETIPKKERT